MNNRKPKGFWTHETVASEALQYATRQDFKSGNKVAHSKACAMGILNEVCAHMDNLPVHNLIWTEETVAAEAARFTTISAFREASGSAYMAMGRLNIKAQVCAHMVTPPRHKKWTDEALAAEALKYTTQSDFREHSSAAWATAVSRGIIDTICAHMDRGTPGFDSTKPGQLYYLRVETRHETLYKIGITNRSVRKRFGSTHDSELITVLHVEEFECGADARRKEKHLHHAHKAYQYTGPKVLKERGNTELFTRDVLGLDVANDTCARLKMAA